MKIPALIIESFWKGKKMYQQMEKQAEQTAREIVEKAGLRKGQILVVGCSSSEVCGSRIGSNSNLEAAQAVFRAIYRVTQEYGIFLFCRNGGFFLRRNAVSI